MKRDRALKDSSNDAPGKPVKRDRLHKRRSGHQKSPGEPTTRDVRPLFEGILEESVRVREGDRTRTITNLDAMFHAELANALKGDPQAIRWLFKQAQKAGLLSKAKPKPYFERTEPEGNAGRIIRAYNAEQRAPRLRATETSKS